MNTELLSLAIALSLSCLALLGVLFSTGGKGNIYLIGMGILWLVVLLAAAAAWTAVAGRVQESVVHKIEGWYWWLLPIYCAYISYSNLTKRPLEERKPTLIKVICALVAGTGLIALLVHFWPNNAVVVETVKQNHREEMKADTAIKDSIGKIDQKLATAAQLDSAQNDSLFQLHSQLLEKTGQIAADVASLKAQPQTPKPNETAVQTQPVPATTLTRRERKKLRRANRERDRARRDSLRHAGVE